MDTERLIFILTLLATTFASLKEDMDALEKVLEAEDLKRNESMTNNRETDLESSLMLELRREVDNKEEAVSFNDFKRRFKDILKRKGEDLFSSDAESNKIDRLTEKRSENQKDHQQDDGYIDDLKDTLSKEMLDAENSVLMKAVSDETSETRMHPISNNVEDEESLWRRSFYELADQSRKRGEFGCKDKRPDCESLKSACDTHSKQMEEVCMKTCGRCACADKISTCEYLRRFEKCDLDVRMQDLCPKTCGFCLMPSPPKCSKSTFGCCWDKETTKDDSKGTNCLPCKDAYRYVCKTFEIDCRKMNTAGTFMRHYCPETCELCSNKCFDNPKSAFYCPFWKKDLKWCDLEKENMRHFCPATCGYC